MNLPLVMNLHISTDTASCSFRVTAQPFVLKIKRSLYDLKLDGTIRYMREAQNEAFNTGAFVHAFTSSLDTDAPANMSLPAHHVSSIKIVGYSNATHGDGPARFTKQH